MALRERRHYQTGAQLLMPGCFSTPVEHGVEKARNWYEQWDHSM